MKLAVFALVISTLSCQIYAQTSDTRPAPPSGLVAVRPSGRIDPQKAADIRRFMEVSGAAGRGLRMMQSLETTLRLSWERSLPPGEYRSKLIDLCLARFRSKATGDSLVTMVIPIYDQHFTDDEIKQLTAFYETPVGKKAIAESPQVVSESQEADKLWGQHLGTEAMSEVLAEHPDLKQALESAQKGKPYPGAKQ
ncbi:MAG: DUF2059 domain-containing protein [Candidatus Korobacteraceae bacterium]